MKKVLDIFFKILDYAEETFIVLCLAFMSIMNFINVVSRYCFSNSFSFTEELTVMAFVWITMFGVAAGYKRCAHLGMSYIVERFPKKGQAILQWWPDKFSWGPRRLRCSCLQLCRACPFR